MYTKVILVDKDGDAIIAGRDEEYKGVIIREAVKADLALTCVPVFSGIEFKKTSYERELLKRCKTRWKNEMRALIPNWTPKAHEYTTIRV